MRVLVVSPYPIAPLTHGGRVRPVGLARGLAAAGAEVTVLSPWHPRQDAVSSLGQHVAHRTHRLPASALLWALPRRVASPQAVLSLNPSRLVRRLLDRLGRFDVYQFEFCALARWADAVPPGAITVYSAHNIERDYFAAERDHYLLRAASARRIEDLERKAVTTSNLVLSCTEQDAVRMQELHGPHRSLVLPHAASPAVGGFSRHCRQRARAQLGISGAERVLLFLGGGAVHNRDAAAFLARDVMPRLGAGIRLILAGESAGMGSHPDDSRILRLGAVADTWPLLAAADVGVNPVLCATGSSVKVRDYLAAGLPVLATEEGARGIGPEAGRVWVMPRTGFVEALSNGIPEAMAPPRQPTWDDLGARLLDELVVLDRARR